MQFSGISLQSLLTRLIAVSLLPPFLFALGLTYHSLREQQQETEREALNLARNFATAIDQHLAARIAALNVLALASPEPETATAQAALYTLARGYQQNFGSHLILTNAEAPLQMLFNTRLPLGSTLPLLPKPQGRAAAPQAIATLQAAVGDLVRGPVSGNNLLAVAVPLIRAGSVRQVLLATFETSHFQERAEQIALPAGWQLSLLDGQGQVIARHRLTGSPERVDEMRQYSAALHAAEWTVTVDIPWHLYWQPLAQTAGLLGGGLLLAGALALWWGRRLSRHLKHSVASVGQLAQPLEEINPIREIELLRQRLAELGALRDSHALLEHKVAERTAELAAAHQRIARFAGEQERRIEAERRRVAREVHDQLGQILTAIGMIIQGLPPHSVPAAQHAALQQALDLGVACVRQISADLRPPLLDDLGLVPALTHLVQNMAGSAGLGCRLNLAPASLCPEQSLILFRIAQEALTNILRHAQARHIEVTGQAGEADYRLSIEDDGIGFVLDAVRPAAMGLLNMRERAALIDGSVRIGPGREGGTRVEIRLPFANKVQHKQGEGHEIPAG